MYKWEKLGKLFDPADLNGRSWMHFYAQSPSVLNLGKILRIFFCSRPAPGPDGLFTSLLSFVDVDAANPTRILDVCTKPPLALGEYGTFDEFGTNPISILRDEGRVLVYYAGWTRCESVPFNAAIGVAESRDEGVTFNRLGPGPVLSYSPDEPFLIGSPRVRKFNGRFYIWYVAGKRWIKTENKPEPVYKLRMAESADGLHWEKFGVDILPDRLGENECQACGDVTYHNGKYHMFYSYRESSNYKTAAGGYRIGYAVSENLRDWSRRDELAGFGPSGNGFDSEMVSYPHVFEVEKDTFMLYQGNGMGRTGFGLARLKAWGIA
jgi:hypothetical protein